MGRGKAGSRWRITPSRSSTSSSIRSITADASQWATDGGRSRLSGAVWHGDDLGMRLSGAAVPRGDDALHVSGRERIAEIRTDGGDDLILTQVFRAERVRARDRWLGAFYGH